MTDEQIPDGTATAVREELQAYFDSAAAYQSRMLEASSGYNQVVVLAGYAGFFAIWSATSAELSRWLILLSGALMGVSLIVYVAWTVYGMIMSRTQMQRMLNEIAEGPVGFLERVQKAEAKGVVAANRYMRFWKPVLWASALPAAVGGILLTGAAFLAVVGAGHRF